MGEAGRVAAGAVIAMGPNLACRVRLDSGEEVAARIPLSVARLMFRIVAGDRVRVRSSSRGVFVVLGHERVADAEQGAAADGVS